MEISLTSAFGAAVSVLRKIDSEALMRPPSG
jgi:hypothetical protein